MNNVTYYSFFDTAVNTYLIQVGGLDIHDGEVVGFVVSSACDYFASIAFPDLIEIGLRVGKLGAVRCSTSWAVFKVGESEAVQQGVSFTYSWIGAPINRYRFRPVREALERLVVNQSKKNRSPRAAIFIFNPFGTITMAVVLVMLAVAMSVTVTGVAVTVVATITGHDRR